MTPSPQTKNHRILEYLYQKFHKPEYLKTDPLSVAHRYKDLRDQETISFIVAAFAFGNIKAILGFLDALLEPIGPHPRDFLIHATINDLQKITDQKYYRWVKDADILLFLWRTGETLRQFESLENAFQCWSDEAVLPDGFPKALEKSRNQTLLYEMATFRCGFMELTTPEIPYRKRTARRRDGSTYEIRSASDTLLPDPLQGAAKRYHLWLRWMIRPADGIDLGCWKNMTSDRLIMPVDTHVHQTARTLRMTRSKTANLALSLELTRKFRRYDPDDPVRFDFSMTRPGIMGVEHLISEGIPEN